LQVWSRESCWDQREFLACSTASSCWRMSSGLVPALSWSSAIWALTWPGFALTEPRFAAAGSTLAGAGWMWWGVEPGQTSAGAAHHQLRLARRDDAAGRADGRGHAAAPDLDRLAGGRDRRALGEVAAVGEVAGRKGDQEDGQDGREAARADADPGAGAGL